MLGGVARVEMVTASTIWEATIVLSSSGGSSGPAGPVRVSGALGRWREERAEPPGEVWRLERGLASPQVCRMCLLEGFSHLGQPSRQPRAGSDGPGGGGVATAGDGGAAGARRGVCGEAERERERGDEGSIDRRATGVGEAWIKRGRGRAEVWPKKRMRG